MNSTHLPTASPQKVTATECSTFKKVVKANLSFSFYMILATIGMLALYAATVPTLPTKLSKLYLLSIVGYYAAALFVVNLALLPTRLTKFTSWIAPLFAWVWLLYLAIDYGTFNLYQFHLNLLLFEMFVTNPSGFGVPLLVLFTTVLVAIGLAAAVYYLNKLSYKTTNRWYLTKSWVMALILPALATNCLIHIWASHYDRDEITSIDALFPVYFPVTSHRHGKTLSDLMPAVFVAERGERLALDMNDTGVVRYPLEPLRFSQQTNQPAKPSILFILLESWQRDSVTPEIMPHLCEFSSTATRFDSHLSGGSTTVPGLFSLMFGLHSSYYDRFKGSPNSNPSQFTESLQNLGYRSRVFTTSHLDRFALRSLFFSRVAKEDYYTGNVDQQIVDQYLANLDGVSATDDPRFDFVFLTSSHSPYEYPAEYAKFKPLPAIEGGFAFNKSADSLPYKNDYHNSLHYCDAMINQILNKLEDQGRLENTWVVITGDHAEEFNENGLGYWGHGSNFTSWQTGVPMIVRTPGQKSGSTENRLSTHQDVIPTLMQNALGCQNPSEDYANGVNLFQLPEKRATVLSSYFTKAYLVDGIVVEGLSGKKYSWTDMKQSCKLGSIDEIRTVMEQERQFLR
jgi:uncharacterized protein